MSPLGTRLRAAREAKGASLEAASREAGAPLRYLQMLEEGHFPTVADPAYLTHFLRRYASYLGLDTEAAARDFLSETEPEAVARRTGRTPPEVRVTPPRARRRPRSLPPGWAVYGILLLVAVSGVFALVRFQQNREASTRPMEVASGPSRSPSVKTAATQRSLAPEGGASRSSTSPAPPPPAVAEPAEPKVADAPTPKPAPTSPPAAEPPVPAQAKPASPQSPAPASRSELQVETNARTAANAAARPPAAVAAAPTPLPEEKVPSPAEAEVAAAREPLRPPFELRLTATSRQVWVWLSVDGGPRQAVSLARGETAVFNANKGYVLSVDDAGGIEAMLNGEPLPSFGGDAQARRNLVIPSAELRPLGANETAGGGKRA